MANCKYCKADCAHRGAQRQNECKGYVPMTKADRIRAMSDEELANWIDQMFGRSDWCDNQCYDMDCVACIQRWLEKTVEVGK